MRRLLLLSFVLAGCATGRFPSRDWVEALSEKPAPPKPARHPAKFVPSWSMSEPVAARYELASAPAEDPLSKRLDALLQVPGSKGTRAIAAHCFASELARFYDAHPDGPAGEMVTFLATRCGLPTAHMRWTSTSWKGADVKDDEELARLAEPELNRMVTELRKDVPQSVGVGLHKGTRAAMVVFAVFEPELALEPVPTQVEPGATVLVKGRALGQETEFDASITRGPIDSVPCESRPVPGGFDLRCPATAGDVTARIEVFGRKKDRLLGTHLAVIDVGVGAPLPNAIAIPDDAALPLKDAASLSGTLIAELNTRRAGAGRGPLIIEQRQENLANRIAPHFVAALEADGLLADRIALGMMAGYEVDGMVEEGSMVSARVAAGADLREVVRGVTESPYGRANLLDPRFNRVAVGSLVDPEGSAAVYLFSYQVVDPALAEGDQPKVREAIDAARKAAGVPPLVWDDGVRDLCADASRKVAAKNADASDALDALISLASSHRYRGSAFVTPYDRPETYKVDSALLDPALKYLGVATFYVRPPHEPWARRLALFFFPRVVEQTASTRPTGGVDSAG